MTTTNRTALVTGATRGIGHEIARQLAEAGHEVWLGSRDAGRGEEAAAQLRAKGFNAHLLPLDVTDDASVAEAARLLAEQTDHLDVLVNNAGMVSPLGPLFGDAVPGSPWHGYYYRILDGQGPSAPGGEYSYKLGDNMSRGFAVIAWPAQYNDTGVMSFMISHEGVVFERDLGADSAKAAAAITTFDPDSSWEEVKTDGAATASP